MVRLMIFFVDDDHADEDDVCDNDGNGDNNNIIIIIIIINKYKTIFIINKRIYQSWDILGGYRQRMKDCVK